MKRQLLISTNILSNKLLPVREFQKVQNHLYSHVKKTHWYFVELQSNWKYSNTRFLVKYVPRCKKIWWNASSQSLSQCASLCGALSLVNELFVTILVCVKIYGRIRCETSSSKYNLVGCFRFLNNILYTVHRLGTRFDVIGRRPSLVIRNTSGWFCWCKRVSIVSHGAVEMTILMFFLSH